MFKLIDFTKGDLIVHHITNPRNPAKKTSRRGIIKEAKKTTVTIHWFNDEDYLHKEEDVMYLSSRLRTMILSKTFEYHPVK